MIQEITFKIGEATLNLIGDGCYPEDVPTLFCKGKDITIQLCGYSPELKKENYSFEKEIKYISNKNYYKISGEIKDLVDTHNRQELLVDSGIPIRIPLDEKKKVKKIKIKDYISGRIYLYGDFDYTWNESHLTKKVRGKITKVEVCLESKGENCLKSHEVEEFEATIFTENSIYITLHISDIIGNKGKGQ